MDDFRFSGDFVLARLRRGDDLPKAAHKRYMPRDCRDPYNRQPAAAFAALRTAERLRIRYLRYATNSRRSGSTPRVASEA